MQLIKSLTQEIIGCAIEVHNRLGPGLLESAYMLCLALEFEHRGLKYQKELDVPLCYRENIIDRCFRIDFLVEEQVILELKAVDLLLPVHEAQMLTYLKLMNKPVGLLFNFNVSLLKNGIRRYVLNGMKERVS